MMAARRKTEKNRRDLGTPASIRLPSDSVIATPTIHRKEGNTTSVMVQPFHSL